MVRRIRQCPIFSGPLDNRKDELLGNGEANTFSQRDSHLSTGHGASRALEENHTTHVTSDCKPRKTLGINKSLLKYTDDVATHKKCLRVTLTMKK